MELKFYRAWKRLMDVSMAILLLLPFLVIGAGIALISIWVFRGQVFFRQPRLGYRNNIFCIYKFTTMLPEQVNGRLLLPAERQSAWGNFLRDYSLDEMPQVINILQGDMSFVGPRPLLPEYKEIYTAAEARRHLVRPGLSGLAQVNGRNDLSWTQKMDFDQQYVREISLRLDMEILWKTFRVVCKGQEINFGFRPDVLPPENESMQCELVPGANIKWVQA